MRAVLERMPTREIPTTPVRPVAQTINLYNNVIKPRFGKELDTQLLFLSFDVVGAFLYQLPMDLLTQYSEKPC